MLEIYQVGHVWWSGAIALRRHAVSALLYTRMSWLLNWMGRTAASCKWICSGIFSTISDGLRMLLWLVSLAAIAKCLGYFTRIIKGIVRIVGGHGNGSLGSEWKGNMPRSVKVLFSLCRLCSLLKRKGQQWIEFGKPEPKGWVLCWNESELSSDTHTVSKCSLLSLLLLFYFEPFPHPPTHSIGYKSIVLNIIIIHKNLFRVLSLHLGVQPIIPSYII